MVTLMVTLILPVAPRYVQQLGGDLWSPLAHSLSSPALYSQNEPPGFLKCTCAKRELAAQGNLDEQAMQLTHPPRRKSSEAFAGGGW
jgi:hypothetical protein